MTRNEVFCCLSWATLMARAQEAKPLPMETRGSFFYWLARF
jgi:hypothetical protein